MNSAEAAKSMQQLLSLWAKTYGSQVASAEEPEVERFSTPPSSPDDNDQLIRQVSGLLNEKFRQLEIQAFQTLFHAVEELDRRCAKMEETLTQRDPETVIHRDTQKSNLPQPSKSSRTATSRSLPTPASHLDPDSGPSMDLDAMKKAMDLFARISQLATTSISENANPFLGGCRGFAMGAVGEDEADSEGFGVVEVQQGKKYQVAQADLKKDRNREEELVVVDANPTVVRELKPRPCHQFYLAKSGCLHPNCTHSHAYKLTKGHLKFMRRFCKTLICQSLKFGKPCKDGKECIHQHKCPDEISCTLGDHCRFASIPEAHPDSREFPKKKIPYDGSKGGKSGGGQTDGNGWYDGNSDEMEEVDVSIL